MIEIIDLLKPKNGGSFKLIEAIDVSVNGYTSLADCVSHMATTAMIEAINAVLSGKQDTLSSAQLAACNSGITAELVTQIGTNTTAIAGKADASDLATATTSLQAQIDNIVTPVTQDAEVQNARVGEDGTSYISLKARLDAEFTKTENHYDDVDDVLELTPSSQGLSESGTITVPYREYETVIEDITLQKDVEYSISISVSAAITKGITVYLYDDEENTLTSKTLAAGETSYSWTYEADELYPNVTIKAYCTEETTEEVTVSIVGGTATPASSARLDKIEEDIEELQQGGTISEDVEEIKDVLDWVPESQGIDLTSTIPIPYREYDPVFENLTLVQGSEYSITISISNAISKGVTMYIYDSEDNVLQSKTIGAGSTSYSWTYTPNQTYQQVTAKAYCTTETGETFTAEISGGTTTPAHSERLDLIEKSNVLFGKKWVVVGDSFTNGSNSYDDVIPDGKYQGKRATYHYLIGNRNDMEIVHMAQGGMTLTTPETILVHNCFSDIDSEYNYMDIPSDADYITIWLGINDSKTESGESSVGETPLGTIDDDTIHTFYGAWNVVLEYLLEHNPYAHIGIVVTNGCTGTNYPNAIKAVARKWGIAYLDLNDDYTIPLMHRVNGKSEVCERAIELRKAAFWVSDSNGHPNAHAQTYQSTFIENWLRTL